MDFVDIKKLYVQKVQEWAKRNEEWISLKGSLFTGHAQQIAASALMTRDGFETNPGDFVNAVVKNDLRGTFGRADIEVRTCLYAILLCYWNVETWDIVKKVQSHQQLETLPK